MDTALAVAAFILEWALTVLQVLAIWLLIGAIVAIGITTLLWRGRTPLWLDEEEPMADDADVIEVPRPLPPALDVKQEDIWLVHKQPTVDEHGHWIRH